MVPDVFPLPGVVHGNRVVATIIETRAKAGANTQPWVSVPIDDNDISSGYRDVSFQQLNNAANHAARWLSQALPATSEPFQYFAYAGPKDLRYPCLAVAAAKLQKVMVLPSPLLTLGAQLRVQEKTNCKLYLRPSEMAGPASNILRNAPHVEQITASGIEEFFRDDEADPMVYSKTWDEGKEDPWLVFHTSGTTGHPKPVTYSQQMMATPDTAASLPDFKPSQIHQSAQARYYTPLPALHTQFIGMFVTLGLTTGHHTTCVVGPPIPPNPKLLINIIRYRKDDYVYLVHGDGIHAALLEEEIVAHPSVKAAVIGGFGRPVPVLLVELVPAAEADDVDALKRSLEPYIEKANVHCHDVVKLSSERLIVAKKGKPFVTTLKGNALRLQTLELYEEEMH
ncbi:AMP-binding enzyme [Blastomyces gilchristii SLH14081]|uniref:AMP-binding enzyme n=1 Tax=Blastomyces gilchristii (strain SLH14081) TaxID=559298 RepID=A0A179UFF2_BLAGS|nr:AMP-binding enzyme [Blastomyces gilchristii SLH14081]OAT05989.1 AMP-binding enzyme [Blastomyces gilchristii SLH14081]